MTTPDDIALPPLQPHDHPEPHTMRWSELEMRAIREYGIACAKAALEAAAGKCDQFAHAAAVDRYLEQNYREGIEQGAIDCAEAIRALAVGSGGSGA